MAEYLRRSGLRKTPERFEILRNAFGMNAHFGVDDLHRKLEESGYHVSRATVYNTVELLMKCGVLRRHIFDTQQASYEVAGTSHVHLVCTRCGSVSEISDMALATEIGRIDFGGFTPSYFSASVYGVCRRCAGCEERDKE